MRLPIALSLFASLASAQYSKDAGVNLPLATGAWEQVQAKVVPLAGGGSYVSWYDSDPGGSPAFGYDVRLQRLDASGNELWGAGGVLVADRGFSSTQDYGLAVDAADHALLAFRDDRLGGVQITAARVDPAGNQVWGPTGVQLTATGAFLASPRIAGTTDGGIVVGWTQDSTSVLQRLDANGAAQWGAGVALPAPAGVTNSLSALHGSDAGSAILSWVRQDGGFFAPRELWAMKLSAAGVPLWPLPGVPVFDAGSLQIGNFPDFAPDGAGGAAFGWYGTSPLQCYAQHVLANGTQAFGANGAEASTDLLQVRANPQVTFDTASGSTYLFWDERNSLQSMSGLYAQKFDAAGNRQWGDTGLAVEPVQAGTIGQIAAVPSGGAAQVFWARTVTFGDTTIAGQRLDAAGVAQHAQSSVCSAAASKDDFDAAPGTFGEAQLVWHDDRTGDNDVYAQTLLTGGGLGPAAGVLGRTAGSNPPSYTATAAPLGGVLTATLDLTTTGHPFGGILGYLGALELSLGGPVLLVNIAHPAGEMLGQPLKAGPAPSFQVSIPNNPAICGLTVYTQGLHYDPSGPYALSNAQDWFLGL